MFVCLTWCLDQAGCSSKRRDCAKYGTKHVDKTIEEKTPKRNIKSALFGLVIEMATGSKHMDERLSLLSPAERRKELQRVYDRERRLLDIFAEVVIIELVRR